MIAELEVHRPLLTGHCYRMLGSLVDADDAVQETLVRAWRSHDRFEGRSSVRRWLVRIATNVCLDEIAARRTRVRPMEDGPQGTIDDELLERPHTHWLEPIPDTVVFSSDTDPAERSMLRESIRLAFVAALQHLPAKQRAALLLTEVLGWSAAEVAEGLDISVAAVNSALQRARATLAQRRADSRIAQAPTPADVEAELIERYVAAFERYDVDALAALLRDDAVLSMPPYSLWLQGPETIAAWLRGRGSGCRGSRLVPVAACGLPAFAQYRVDPAGGHAAWSLTVLELAGDQIAAWNSFLAVDTLFPRFGLPLRLA